MNAIANITTYEGPQGISASNNYAVRVNDGAIWKDSFMYYIDGDDMRGSERYLSFTNFEMNGGIVTVEVTNLKEEISSCTIRPKKYKITPTIDGNKVTFTLNQPLKVEVEINGSSTNLCYVFANSPDGGVPTGTTYVFSPGVYDVGTVELNSNEKVYVEGGAYVKGVFKFKDGTSGQQILGYGIISGENYRGVGPMWSNMNGTQKNSDWTFVNSTGQIIKNVTFIRPSEPFLVWIVNGTLVDNVKFLSHPDNARGICNGGNGAIAIYGKTQAFTLQNCFAFTADDCYKFEYNDISGSIVKDSTVANVGGSPLGGIWNDVLGVNTRGVTVQDCDVIQTSNGNYDGCEAAIYAMPDGDFGSHGPVYDITFKNLTIEDDNTDFNRLFAFCASYTGEVYNINFENVNIEKNPTYKCILRGSDEIHKVRDIEFIDVKINGTYVTDCNKGEYIEMNNYASNIRFVRTDRSSEINDTDN